MLLGDTNSTSEFGLTDVKFQPAFLYCLAYMHTFYCNFHGL